jgi:uncharacterized membrane protein YhaH (DUF805 family)
VMKRPRLRAYLGLGLLAAGLCGLALSGDLLQHPERLWAFYGLSLAGFGLLASAATSLPLRVAVVAAVIVRLLFLPGVPSLSDDFYRYLWDGRVQLAGENPYLYAPADPRLDGVAFAGRADVNHPRLRTVYPPLEQATFLGVAAASDAAGRLAPRGEQAIGAAGAAAEGATAGAVRRGLLALKLVAGAADLLTAAAVWWLAGARRRRQATVLYLLCPAVIVQTWESAHLEVVAVGLAVLAAGLLVRGRDWQSGIALGLAAAFRLMPAALLVPALLGGRAKPARFLAGFIPALVVPYLPYLLRGGAFGSLWQSGTGWTGSSLLFSLLTIALSPQIARLLCLAVFVAGAVLIARRLRGRPRTAEAFAWTLTWLVVCLPVVHAWYWLMPLTFGLVAGVWLPVVLGLAAPLPEALTTRWPRGHAWTILGR